MDLQTLFNAVSAQHRAERSDTQLTLGELMTALERRTEPTVQALGGAHSYRGYYSDLAFEADTTGATTMPTSALLDQCQRALGATFEGYKGGDYVMGKTTPLWFAEYGCCGQKIMSLEADGTFTFADDND